MKFIFLLLILCLSFVSSAQAVDCKDAIHRSPNMFTHRTQVRDSLINADYYIFGNCCGWDSVELNVLGPFIARYVFLSPEKGRDTMSYEEITNAFRRSTSSWKVETTISAWKRDEMVRRIARDNKVDAPLTGAGSTISDTYKCFDTLMRVTSNSDLLKLTDHRSPAVRVYAIWGLAKRHYPGLPQLIEAHLSDTASLDVMIYCNRWEEPVNKALLEILSPQPSWDLFCTKFSEAEIDDFRRRMIVVER